MKRAQGGGGDTWAQLGLSVVFLRHGVLDIASIILEAWRAHLNARSLFTWKLLANGSPPRSSSIASIYRPEA